MTMNYVLRNLAFVFLGILLLSSMSFAILRIVNYSTGGDNVSAMRLCNNSIALPAGGSAAAPWGGLGTPYQNLTAAINAASAGDYILICGNGTGGITAEAPWTINVSVNIFGYNWTSGIGTVGVGPNTTTVLKPFNSTTPIFTITANGVHISNLTFSTVTGAGPGVAAIAFNNASAWGLWVNYSNFTLNVADVLFSAGGNDSNLSGNNHFGGVGSGVVITAAIRNVSIWNSSLTGYGTGNYALTNPAAVSGIYVASASNVSVAGVFVSQYAYGLYSAFANNLTVNNQNQSPLNFNRFFNNTYGIYLNGTVGVAPTVSDTWIYNSSNNSTGFGMYVLNSNGSTFTNLTMWDNYDTALYLANSSTNTIANSNFSSKQSHGSFGAYLDSNSHSNTITGGRMNESYARAAIAIYGNSNSVTLGLLNGTNSNGQGIIIGSGSANAVRNTSVTDMPIGVNVTTASSTTVGGVNASYTTNAFFIDQSNSTNLLNSFADRGNGTGVTLSNTNTGGNINNVTVNETAVTASTGALYLVFANNTVISSPTIYGISTHSTYYILLSRVNNVNVTNANLTESGSVPNQTGLFVSTTTSNVNVTNLKTWGFWNQTTGLVAYAVDFAGGTGHSIRDSLMNNSSTALAIFANVTVDNNTLFNCGWANNFAAACLVLGGNGNTASSSPVRSNIITNATYYSVSVYNTSSTPGAFSTFASNTITNGTYGIFLNNSNLTFSAGNTIQSLLATGFDIYSVSGGYISTLVGSTFYNVSSNYSLQPSGGVIHMPYALGPSVNFAVRPFNVSNVSAIPGAPGNWTLLPNITYSAGNVISGLANNAWTLAKAMKFVTSSADYYGLNITTTVGTASFSPVMYFNETDLGADYPANKISMGSWNLTRWSWHDRSSYDLTYDYVYQTGMSEPGYFYPFVYVPTTAAAANQGGLTQANTVPSISTKQNCPDDTLTVTVSKSGGVASGATVKLYRESPYLGLLETKSSDSDGKATFATKGTGIYSVEVTGSGYTTTTSSVSYTACTAESAATTTVPTIPTPEAAPEVTSTPAPSTAPAGTGAGTGTPAGESATPSEQPAPSKETGAAGTGKAPEVHSQLPTAAAGATGGNMGTILLVVVVIVVVAIGIYFFTKKGGSSKGIYKGFKR